MKLKLRKIVRQEHTTGRGIRVTDKNYIQVAAYFGKLPAIVEIKTESQINASGDESKQKIRLKIKGVGWRVANVGDVLVKNFSEDGSPIFIRPKKDFEGFSN